MREERSERETPPLPPRGRTIDKYLIQVSCSIVLVLSCAHFAYWSARFLMWPYLINYGEGLSLWGATQLLAGQPIYVDVNQAPYVLFPYPVGYPLLSAGFVFAFGSRLLSLRLLTLLCEGAIALVVYGIVVHRSGRKLLAACVASVVLGLFSIHDFHSLARVDFVELLFVFLAVRQFLLFVEDRNGNRLIGFSAATMAGLLTKPIAVVTLSGCGLYALVAFRSAPRDLIRCLAAFAAAAAGCVAVTLALDLQTGGEYFRHTFAFHTQKGTQPSLWLIEQFWSCYWPVVIGSALGLLFCGSRLLNVLTLISVGCCVIALRRDGADLNYTLEPLVFMTILTGLLIAEVIRHMESASATGLRVHGLRVAAMILFVAILIPLRQGPARGQELHAEARSEGATLDQLTRETQGTTLSEEPYFAVVNRKPFLLADPYGLLLLAERGLFDLGPVIDALRAQAISRVFVGWRLARNPEIVRLLREKYRPIYKTKSRFAETRWLVLEPLPPRSDDDEGGAGRHEQGSADREAEP